MIARAAKQLGAVAALIHTDLGTGDHAANTAMGKWLGPALDTLAVKGGWILANQPLDVARWQRQPDPPGVPTDRYFLYKSVRAFPFVETRWTIKLRTEGRACIHMPHGTCRAAAEQPGRRDQTMRRRPSR